MPTNRLNSEKSPYLLQHAQNPVDWYPWGEEAFAKARAEEKPIFLSVGYSTCHWCHVMERESFENESIADYLNEHFVSIKVDREERPDVDRIYMTFVQATSGGGGWPMSVFLTPELKPFFGGTYFPPEDRWGRAGFPRILAGIKEAWATQRQQVTDSSQDMLKQIAAQVEVRGSAAMLRETALESGFNAFRRSFDARLGGFGGAPKFPRPAVYNFLLREYARAGNREALDMVLLTLREMAKGGMNDQLGGGFHRYSVDDRWFVPHFEKMLYDQAQLAISYLEAFQITGEETFAATARRIFEYVLRDLRDPDGGFYSAEDADSVVDPAHPHEKGEGAFYIWTQAEIEEAVGGPAAEWICYRYGVEEDGNVRQDPHNEFTGRNILYQAHTVEETARRFDAAPAEVARALAEAEEKLLALRSATKVRPHLDDKVLTAWNGLMISAFAKGGAVLNEPRYAEAARLAADFVASRLYRDGKLLRRYRQGEAAIPGLLDDYAFFVQALLDLYEAQFAERDLELALRLTKAQRELYEDAEAGAFFSSDAADASLVMRLKEDYDGAEPSGNSVTALNLLRLAQMTGSEDLRASAGRTLAAFARRIMDVAHSVPQMLVAYQFSLAKPMQVVLAGDPGTAEFQALARVVHGRFAPLKVVLHAGTDLPSLKEMKPIEGKPAAYVCENFACQLPVTEAQALAELLG